MYLQQKIKEAYPENLPRKPRPRCVTPRQFEAGAKRATLALVAVGCLGKIG
jgi:hypothetical protein